MIEFTLMSGISGSGKSTKARQIQRKNPGTVVVSRDDLRIVLFDQEFGGHIDEDLISSIELQAIRSALLAGHNVISDNTNLSPDRIYERIRVASDIPGVKVSLVQTETSLEQALENNRRRKQEGGRFVPEHVIENQYERFLKHREEIKRQF